MSMQLGFLLNQHTCVGCQSCQTACQEKNNSAFGISLRIADSYEFKPVGPYMTASCHHCEAPICVQRCPIGAISKRTEDGIVVINSEVCINCRICENACPYNAIKFTASTGKVEKCDFCVDRLSENDIPACVENCPVKSLTFGDLAVLSRRGTVHGVGFRVEATRPAVRFILPK